MTFPAPHFAFNLLKANLEFQLRLAQLAQDSGRRWLALGTQQSAETLAQTQAKLNDARATSGASTYGALPVEAMVGQMQHGMADLQSAQRGVLDAQAAFTEGLRAAIVDWQQACMGAMGNGSAAPNLQDMANQWNTGWQALYQQFQAPAAPPQKRKVNPL